MSARHSQQVLPGHCWYRLAARPGISQRLDMFHAPFESSQRPCRFSPPGAPALYLANSVYLCWKECGEPPLDQCFVARFEVDAPSGSYLELACSHEAYRQPFDKVPGLDIDPCAVTNSPYRNDVVAEVAEYLTVWPLSTAVSVVRADISDEAAPEYLIPQLLMGWIRRAGDFLGIRYFTTRFERSMSTQDWEINLALPARSARARGFCEFLMARTRCTVPVPMSALSRIPDDFLSTPDAAERRAERWGRLDYQPSQDSPSYRETAFVKMEYLLDHPIATLAPIEPHDRTT